MTQDLRLVAFRKASLWKKLMALQMAHRRTDMYLYQTKDERYHYQGKILMEKMKLILRQLDGRWPESDDIRLDYRFTPKKRERPRVQYDVTKYGRWKHLYTTRSTAL